MKISYKLWCLAVRSYGNQVGLYSMKLNYNCLNYCISFTHVIQVYKFIQENCTNPMYILYKTWAKHALCTKTSHQKPLFLEWAWTKITQNLTIPIKKARSNYGQEYVDSIPDVSSDRLSQLTASFYDQQLKVNANKSVAIDKQTRLQGQCGLRYSEGKKRIIASIVQKVSHHSSNIRDKKIARLIVQYILKAHQ